MADPVQAPGQTPNQPASPDPAAAAPAAAPAAVIKPADAPAAPAAAPAAAAPAPAATPDPAAPAAAVPAAAPAAAPPAAVDPNAATADAAAAAAAVLPETYTMTVPQGLEVVPNLMPALTPALKEAKLTQKQFDIVSGAFLEFQKGLPAQMLERDLEATRKDPELGGMKLPQTLASVKLALETFSDAQFSKFMMTRGFGNRPEFVRVFARIGEALARSTDGVVRGEPDAAAETSVADRLYGKPKTG